MSDAKQPIIEDLGEEFEILEDPGAARKAAAAPPAAHAAARPGAPIRSTEAWISLGLSIGLAGLFGDWNAGTTGNLIHGLLMAGTLWALLRGGLAAVQQTHPKIHPGWPALLCVYGAGRVFFGMTGSDAMARVLEWSPGGGVTAVSGAIFTFIGGALALLAPSLRKKADAALPPQLQAAPVDKQFSGSLLAYLMCAIGLTMEWRPLQTGAESIFGVITLICVLLALWASWVGMWRHWAMPLVTGKLGMILFLAPIEAMIMGLAGLALLLDEPPGFITEAWPVQSSPMGFGGLDGMHLPFLVYSGGPLLTLMGAGIALYLLLTGAKQAIALSAEKKKQEIEERKAKRASRKGSTADAK